jgi:diaminohydroxyphosphoribosylaminopyrimidine deaminase/5-amino-6-(5-phosphoribosylamino)uracil reductase
MSAEEAWMRLALEQAACGRGLTSPNPCVGAVIVKDGQLLGQGWHRRAGGPHAEIEALADAAARGMGDAVRGADIYITLEPCSTHGRTPPCVEALIRAGVGRVIWGADDPNPRHAGRARELLHAAGMAVISGVLTAECMEMITPFSRFITTGMPWVTAKAGMSLDGRITRPPGEGQWITGESSRADAMQLRLCSDAILVGAETVRQDDPALTVRGVDLPAGKEQPWRIVLSRSGNLPLQCRLLTDEFRERTLVFSGEQCLREMLRDLAGRGIVSLLVEGGGSVLAQFFAADLVDEAVFYIAPLISGSGRAVVDAAAYSGGSLKLEFSGLERIGSDVKLVARRRPAD